MQNSAKKNPKGFSFFEIIIAVFIVGVLASIAIGFFVSSAKKKKAIEEYKTSMESLRSGMEFCAASPVGIDFGSWIPNSPICQGSQKYPAITSECGNYSELVFVSSGSGSNWEFTTARSGGGSWNCFGCQLYCDTDSCTPVGGSQC